VLTLVARGKTGAKIAAMLLLSPTTVQTHVSNALVKLDANNRVHAVTIALRAGEIDIDDVPLRLTARDGAAGRSGAGARRRRAATPGPAGSRRACRVRGRCRSAGSCRRRARRDGVPSTSPKAMSAPRRLRRDARTAERRQT